MDYEYRYSGVYSILAFHKSILIQVMACCRTGDNLNQWWPTSLTHICITRGLNELTHWGRVTHICVSKLAIIGSDNGLSPDRRQAIIWTNAGLLLIGHLGTNFSEILIEILKIFIQENAIESVVCETVAILSRPQCVKEFIITSVL